MVRWTYVCNSLSHRNSPSSGIQGFGDVISSWWHHLFCSARQFVISLCDISPIFCHNKQLQSTIEGEKLQLIFILIACTVVLNALLATPTPVTHNLLSRILYNTVIIHRCSDTSAGLLSGNRSSSSSVTILGSEYSWLSTTLSEGRLLLSH